MRGSIPLRPTVVWVLLVAVTGASFWLGTDHPFQSLGVRVASATALGIAFLKAYLVGQDFMEVRGAPAPLRWAFATWIVAFGSVTIGLYAA